MSRHKLASSSIKSQQSTGSLPKEEVNVVLLGKQSVGKSALVVKYLTKRFICEYDPFLGQSARVSFAEMHRRCALQRTHTGSPTSSISKKCLSKSWTHTARYVGEFLVGM